MEKTSEELTQIFTTFDKFLIDAIVTEYKGDFEKSFDKLSEMLEEKPVANKEPSLYVFIIISFSITILYFLIFTRNEDQLQVIDHLTSMFPAVEKEEILQVARKHNFVTVEILDVLMGTISNEEKQLLNEDVILQNLKKKSKLIVI